MAILTKENALYERDEEGKLIPKKQKLGSGEEVMVTPLTRGEIMKLFSGLKDGETTKDQDLEILKGHCIEPAFTDEELKWLKPLLATEIVLLILRESGLDMNKNLATQITLKEGELEKNSDKGQESKT